jgi:hypothetical protein
LTCNETLDQCEVAESPAGGGSNGNSSSSGSNNNEEENNNNNGTPVFVGGGGTGFVVVGGAGASAPATNNELPAVSPALGSVSSTHTTAESLAQILFLGPAGVSKLFSGKRSSEGTGFIYIDNSLRKAMSPLSVGPPLASLASGGDQPKGDRSSLSIHKQDLSPLATPLVSQGKHGTSGNVPKVHGSKPGSWLEQVLKWVRDMIVARLKGGK